jgi:hypothetical protein
MKTVSTTFICAANKRGFGPRRIFMEDYDDAAGQAHQEDLLRQQETEEALGLFSPVYVLPSQQLTDEIQYFKSMEA